MANHIERFQIPPLLMLFSFFTFLFGGCAQYQPRLVENLSFLDRARTQEEEDVRVTVAVLVLTDDCVPFDQIERFDWDDPGP